MNGIIADALPSAHFTALDWLVVAGYLALTTLIGARLAGRQATIRDYFLGGRKLPWWAVCGSILATEVSAVTFIVVPAIVYRSGGDFRYLQFALGSILGRILIGIFFVPAYYSHEIYSPYEFMGLRLGRGADTATTALFFLGALLSQGVRLFTTALVLEIVAGIDLAASIWLIGLFAVVWTLLGGITTVIWTDVIQFVVLVAGACVALAWVFGGVPGGAAEVLNLGAAAGKFRVWDFSIDPSREYTLWSALLGILFLNLAAFGTDQVMAQRMFCCRDTRSARLAIIASSAGVVVAALMLFVGAGLYAYFAHFPLNAAESALVADRAERVFPIFIVRVLPVGITGIVIAAVFAAAISTLDSTLAALAQTTVTSVWQPWRAARGRPPLDAAAALRGSKRWVVLWGIVLCGVATGLIFLRAYRNLIDMALGVTSFTYGALLGTFLVALYPRRRDDRGLIYGVAASVLAIIVLQFHADWTFWVAWPVCAALMMLGLVELKADVRRLAVLAAVLGAILVLQWLTAEAPGRPARLALAYPWFFPIGTAITFVLGLALGRPPPPDRPPNAARP